MKLLVFAHTPPPHHGQSYMVSLMIEGLGGDRRQAAAGTPVGDVECYHVNARYSGDLEELGAFGWKKPLLVFRYCAEAIWCRFKYGVRAFYYCPAPGKRGALYRDWMVMLLCRPFFAQFIHHWHAVGLGDWLVREGFWWERRLTHRLLGSPALGIALAVPVLRDSLWFRSREVEIIPNGIPDPCPNAETEVIPAREQRLRARRSGEASVFRVLYLAHCMTQKGFFDVIDAVRLLASRLAAEKSPLRVHLTIAGEFLREDEKARFTALAQEPGFADTITYAGFVSGADKARLLAESDCLCFPTYYHAEALPVVIVEALAAGLPVVTTRWRGIPEILPPEHAAFVPARSPDTIAERLRDVMLGAGGLGVFGTLRRRFTERFVTARYLESLREAFQHAADPEKRAVE